MEAPEYGITDQLDYHYRGNQLMAVNDATETPEGNVSDFKDNGSKGDLNNPEYDYDANGNMIRDDNKGITVSYNLLNLPERVDFSNSMHIEYGYDATGTKLWQTVYDGGNPESQIDYIGAMVYEDGQLQFIHHDEGRAVMVDSEGLSKLPEYQYHLKDHLGNVRLTFTASPETESGTATLEPVHGNDERAAFLRYDETTKINAALFDHTGNGDTHYAIRLNGTANERRGLAKSLAVMTGDTVRAEVFAKYLDPDQNNWTTALQNLMAAIAGGTAPVGTVIEAVPPNGGDGFPFAGLLDAAKAGDTGPQAYLNILVFDENLTFIDGAFAPVTGAAMENGTNVPHERLAEEIVVQQPGFVYIYLSNDNDQPLEVFFDDFTVEHAHSAIVQADDYYPFGLSIEALSSSRENTLTNNYLYNSKELQTDLGLDWYDYGARMYMPDLGRFFTQDRYADKYRAISPYQYAANDPINLVDINGDSIWFTFQHNKAGELTGVTMNVTGKVMTLSSDDIDMDNAVSDISSAISSAFEGSFEVKGEGISFNTNVQLSEASSMDDVAKSDHLFVIGDNDGSTANGASNMIGGKVAFLNTADFSDNGSFMGFFGWSDTRTSTHEFGHLAGLTHESASGFFNLMKSGGSGTNVTSDQLKRVTSLGTNNRLNKGENYIRNPFTGKKSPNTTLIDTSGKSYHINQVGIRLRLDKLK